MGGFSGHIILETLESDIQQTKSAYDFSSSYETEHASFLADGFIYNLKELNKKYASSTDNKALFSSYRNLPQHFPQELRGEFSTVLKTKEKLEVATNQTSSRRIFYSEFNGKLHFHWNLKKLLSELGSSGFQPSPNSVALRSLISIGGVFGNQTVVNDIYLLRAGEKIQVDKNGWRIEKYYTPNTEGSHKSKSEFFEEIHASFSKVVRQQYNHEGLMGFQLLSGGLDSRLNLSLASQNKIKQQAVLCFGQTGYRDHWISEQIAEAYNLKHDFVPLENGDYLKAIDENILAVDGLNFYASSAHFNYALDHSKYLSPIIHTGQIGRTIFTEHPFGLWQNLSEYSALLCSNRFVDSINTEVKKEMELYSDMDVFYLYNRLYRVISSGNFVAQKAGFIVSPFADPDVQDLAYSMPMEWKKNGMIQWEYMWKYHKNIMKYSQEEYGIPIKSKSGMLSGKVQNKLRNIYYKKINKSPDKLSMNPLGHWWNENEGLRKYYKSYFNENIERLEHDKELMNMCRVLFDSENMIEKMLALTAVGVMKNYFS